MFKSQRKIDESLRKLSRIAKYYLIFTYKILSNIAYRLYEEKNDFTGEKMKQNNSDLQWWNWGPIYTKIFGFKSKHISGTLFEGWYDFK